MKLLFWALGILILTGCANVVTPTSDASRGMGTTASGASANATPASGRAVRGFNKNTKQNRSDDDAPRPFDETVDPQLDIEAALAQAQITGKNVLLIFGGNWCHDSRGLAQKFEEPELRTVIAENFELVWVNIGFQDRNMNILKRFGVHRIYGTPVVLILSPNGEIRNGDSMHDWRAADSRPYQEALDYFQSFAISARSDMS